MNATNLLRDLTDWSQGLFRVETGPPTPSENALIRATATGFLPGIAVYALTTDLLLTIPVMYLLVLARYAYERHR